MLVSSRHGARDERGHLRAVHREIGLVCPVRVAVYNPRAGAGLNFLAAPMVERHIAESWVPDREPVYLGARGIPHPQGAIRLVHRHGSDALQAAAAPEL